MAEDTVVVELEGAGFLLDDLEALVHFRGLLDELAADAAGGAAISWKLRRFGAGSLVAEVQGVAEDRDAVRRVVDANGRVWASLAEGGPFPFSDAARRCADRLTSMLDGRVTTVRFRSGARVSEINRPTGQALAAPLPPPKSLGAVTGVVETLSRRNGPRFVVYPDDGGGVACYVPPRQEERLRELWGKRVRVEGLLQRHRETGAPQSIREVTHIEVVEPSAGDIEDLWGILPLSNRKPEDVLREAW